MRFLSKLKTHSISDQERLNRLVLTRNLDQNRLRITAFLPTEGEFGIELYANNPECDENQFYPIWQILVNSDRPSNVSIPNLESGFLGCQPLFSKSGLKPTNYIDPFIQTSIAELKMEFEYEENVRADHKIFHCEQNSKTNYFNFGFHQWNSSGNKGLSLGW